MTKKFFDEQTDQSLVKATIVSKYFVTWAKIMINTQKNNARQYGRSENRIAYLDLFAGPGRYEDGSKSTPMLVLEEAVKDSDISERLVTLFNDKDSDNIKSLESVVNSFPNIHKLTHKPQIMNKEVGSEMVKLFEKFNLVPTLFFVDPWGYKGLSLRLVNSVLKDFGCDCIFFFNYNRINMGIANTFVEEHMEALFGDNEVKPLREELAKLDTDERELLIVERLAQALKEYGGQYVLPFRFRNERGTRTSHHLIFVSKHFRGYEKMKEVMASESSSNVQGVPSFEYSLATERQPLLFALSRPLDELGDMILKKFAGQSIKMVDIYEQHNVGTPYIKSNYKDILWQLEEAGK